MQQVHARQASPDTRDYRVDRHPTKLAPTNSLADIARRLHYTPNTAAQEPSGGALRLLWVS